MTTMRPLLRRVELSWIGFLLVGALCGALVMFGVDTLRQTGHDATSPQVAVPQIVAPVQAVTLAVKDNVGQSGSFVSTASSQPILGPSEGLNAASSDSSANDSIPPIIDTSGGHHSKR